MELKIGVQLALQMGGTDKRGNPLCVAKMWASYPGGFWKPRWMIGDLCLIFYQEPDSHHFDSIPLPCPVNASHVVSCLCFCWCCSFDSECPSLLSSHRSLLSTIKTWLRHHLHRNAFHETSGWTTGSFGFVYKVSYIYCNSICGFSTLIGGLACEKYKS